jgi:hypothetical protein
VTMASRLWRGSWYNPGIGEQPKPILDLVVNRNLTVNNNATIKGSLTLSSPLPILGTWQNYIPTARGFTTPPPGITQATNFHYTATGRWRKLDTIVFFQHIISIGLPVSANWNSNLYVDLPTKTNFNFTAQGTWKPQNQDDRAWVPCFGLGKVGTNQIMIGADANDPQGTGGVLFAALGTFSSYLPMDVIISGSYEYQA